MTPQAVAKTVFTSAARSAANREGEGGDRVLWQKPGEETGFLKQGDGKSTEVLTPTGPGFWPVREYRGSNPDTVSTVSDLTKDSTPEGFWTVKGGITILES
ncbi:MAG: hypothetical protein Fur0025_00880 [Oscillatoriaceae cyanobacterium]